MPFEMRWNAPPSTRVAEIMPRRKKPYFRPGTTFIDGGRFEASDEEDLIGAPPPVEIDIEAIRKKLTERVRGLDELVQLDDPDQFIKDLADECASALSL